MADKENENTEGVDAPSVDTVKVETVEKKFHDEIVSSQQQEILNLQTDLEKEKKYSKSLEDQLSEYSDQLDSKKVATGEFDHIPLVNVIDGERKTRDEIIQDKELLKLFKK